MVAVNIKSVGQMTEENYFWAYKMSFQKNGIAKLHRYSIKMCFLHTYIIEKYFKDKLTI